MTRRRYQFTSYDLKYKRELEKKRGSKIPDEEFYKYTQKLREQLNEYVEAVKKWVTEKPWEAEQLSKLVKDWEEKETHKELYEKLAKIKKLTIAELQKLLVPALKRKEYTKLELLKPEIGKYVVAGFSVQDSKVSRGEHDSKMQLQRTIRKALENTNWRLMSGGVNYRLGIISGRLRGYENEEDLLSLILKDSIQGLWIQ